MELLNIRDNRPFIKRELLTKEDRKKKQNNEEYQIIEGKIEYLRDWCFLDFNENGLWTIKVNEEKQSGAELSRLTEIFNELRMLKKNKHKSSVCRRLVFWTNNLARFQNLIAVLCGHKFEKVETNRVKDKKILWIYDNDFEFRSFNAISGDEAKRIGDLYNLEGDEVDIMEAYIKLQEQNNWATFRYTASHNSEKVLERRIEKDMTEKEREQYNQENYKRNNSSGNQLFNQWVRRGCLSGAIWVDKNYQRKPLEWVSSFDISQAYGGQFVRANDFPLGTIVDAMSLSKEEVMKRKWYAFVFEFDSYPGEVFQWMIPFKKEDEKDGLLKDDKWYLFIEKTDIDCMKLMGAKFKIKPRIIHQFICDNNIGYLHYKVRKTINDLYEERQKLKAEGSKREKIVKQICEVAYGKGLQDRKSWHYFCPQISYHALAKTRYELLLMLTRIKNDIVAIDTDGIKTAYDRQKSIETFFQRNEEIKKELTEAGFPESKIGTWKFEGTYKQFIQYEKKVYAYEDEEGLHCKFAGCSKEQLDEFLLNCRDMNGLLNCLAIPGGIIDKKLKVDKNFYAVETIYKDYSLVKEEMDAFFNRQKIICMSA